MSRSPLVVRGLVLVGFSLGLVPALSGCSDSAATSAAPTASQAELKKQQDEATAKAFKDYQKSQKTQKRKK